MTTLINQVAEDAACVFVCQAVAGERLRIAQALTPEHFATEGCRRWWQAVRAQVADGASLMFGAVVSRLERDKTPPPYGAQGWASFQAAIRESSREYLRHGGLDASERADQLIYDVTNAAELRRVRHLCASVLGLCDEPNAKGAELVAELAKALPQSATEPEDEDVITFTDAARDYATNIHAQLAATVPSPWPALDANVRLAPGTMHVLAAATGVGKSVVGLQYARACWRAGRWCLYFCLEMPARAMAARLTRQERGVNHRPETDDDVRFLLGAMAHVAKDKPKIRFAQRPDRTIESLALAVQAWKARIEAEGEKLGLVVIDYLKLLSPSADDEKARRAEHQIMSEQARRIKILAMQLGIPILCLAQLNRDAEKAGISASRGMMADSYGVIRHADAVYIMARDTDRNQGPAVFKIAKARDGDTGDLVATWEPQTQTYRLTAGEP